MCSNVLLGRLSCFLLISYNDTLFIVRSAFWFVAFYIYAFSFSFYFFVRKILDLLLIPFWFCLSYNLAALHKFWYIAYSFSSEYFLIITSIYFMTHKLFFNVCMSLNNYLISVHVGGLGYHFHFIMLSFYLSVFLLFCFQFFHSCFLLKLPCFLYFFWYITYTFYFEF